MTIRHQQSPAITAADAATTPFIVKPATAGEGGKGVLAHKDAFITATASADTDSTWQLVRLPSNCILKEVIVHSVTQGATGGLFDVGFAYATDGLSAGSKANHSPLVVGDMPTNWRTSIASAALDPEAQSSLFRAYPGLSEVVNGATPALAVPGLWLASTASKHLWDVLGLASDPGGNFDLCIANTEGLGTGAGLIYASVKYIP